MHCYGQGPIHCKCPRYGQSFSIVESELLAYNMTIES